MREKNVLFRLNKLNLYILKNDMMCFIIRLYK